MPCMHPIEITYDMHRNAQKTKQGLPKKTQFAQGTGPTSCVETQKDDIGRRPLNFFETPRNAEKRREIRRQKTW